MSSPLPQTMKALVQEEKNAPLVLKDVPVPTPTPGSVIIKVSHSLLHVESARILNNTGGFTYPTPIIPGGRAIGRIAAVGPDTTALTIGQLVLLEPFVRARDNPETWIMWGTMDGVDEASKKFFKDNWQNGTWAEYTKAPLEVTWALDENRLCKELGYAIPDLLQLCIDVVPYSGLKDVGFKPGERLLATPATGHFSGATVGVAIAMGATVVATGRNESALKRLKAAHPDMVQTVVRTGDLEQDTANLKKYGTIDAFLEMTPMGAEGSTHVQAAFGALRQYGRACMMGMGAGPMSNVEIPQMQLVFKSITVHGHAMYWPEDVREVIKMAEAGVLKLGRKRGFDEVKEFAFADYDKAFDWVSEQHELGQTAVLVP